MPTPCSPLRVPPSSTVMAKTSFTASWALAHFSGSPLSVMMFTWMLPSPAWPKQTMGRPYFSSRAWRRARARGSWLLGTTISSLILVGAIWAMAGEMARRAAHRSWASSLLLATLVVPPVSWHTRATLSRRRGTRSSSPSTSMRRRAWTDGSSRMEDGWGPCFSDLPWACSPVEGAKFKT